MKNIEINHLQQERGHWLHKAHKNQTNENWRNRNVRNEIKKKNYQSGKKLSCTGTVKICKVIHHILSPDGKTLKADPSALNKFFDGEIP